MIKFIDFFKVETENVKVKFNMKDGDGKLAIDNLFNDNDAWIRMNAWRKHQASNNLDKAKYLIALAQYPKYGSDFFMFGGFYKVEIIDKTFYNKVGYKLQLMDQYKEYSKRLIIKLKKPIGRDIYSRNMSNIQESLDPIIFELTPEHILEDFPGYNNVLLTHKEMQSIFRLQEPKWQEALSNVKAVYCITDTSNGKLYIGSASGSNDGLWQRWSQYANCDNLTGGNKVFEEIKANNPNFIINNFTYSILEIFDTKTKQEYILERETFWKKVLKTKEFGMNKN